MRSEVATIYLAAHKLVVGGVASETETNTSQQESQSECRSTENEDRESANDAEAGDSPDQTSRSMSPVHAAPSISCRFAMPESCTSHEAHCPAHLSPNPELHATSWDQVLGDGSADGRGQLLFRARGHGPSPADDPAPVGDS